MREAEDKRRNRAAAEAKLSMPADAMKSAWDPDDESEDDDEDSVEDETGDDTIVVPSEQDDDSRYMMPATAQRALDYITGRRDTDRQQSPHYQVDGTKAAKSTCARGKLTLGSKGRSQSNLPAVSPYADAPAQPSKPSLDDSSLSVALSRSATEKRQSTSSSKRLSFTEFTKRLSSTSSLLLVQNNTSGASSRSSDADSQHQLTSRGAGNSASSQQNTLVNDRDRDSQDKRCGWRGSVGVFGSEGGFL
jgi:hypothetical protein